MAARNNFFDQTSTLVLSVQKRTAAGYGLKVNDGRAQSVAIKSLTNGNTKECEKIKRGKKFDRKLEKLKKLERKLREKTKSQEQTYKARIDI